MHQPPRLFLGANHLASPGRLSVTHDLAKRLQRHGYESTSASRFRSGILGSAHLLSTALLRRRKYDVAVVDLYSGRAFLWGEALATLLTALGCPFIIALHGGALPDFARGHGERVRACLRKAAAVLTPSRYLLEQMRPYRSDLFLLPNAIDVDIYRFTARQAPQPLLLWLRAFHETYNPSLVPRALALLEQDFPDIHMNMVGPDKGDGSLQRMQKLAASLHVLNRITIHGAIPKSEVANWLNRGDIFLNTTNVDNTPVSVLEAMACGLCVVSTSVGGIPYLLEHEQDSLLVPPDNPEAMAAAVGRILTEPGLAEHLSRNARRKVEQFDWSLILPQWEKLLGRVAKMSNGSTGK
jgi:glycosyltransferase involved in cell wall biosynthesis